MVEVARAFTVTEDAARSGHPRRADLLARCAYRRPAAGLRPPLRRRRQELHPDLASAGRSAAECRPHRGDARRQGGRRRTRPRLSTATRWSRRWAARKRIEKTRREIAAGRAGGPARCGSARGRPGRATAPSLSRARARSSASPGLPATARPICCWRSSPPRRAPRAGIEVTAPVALVAGDRQADGIFPQWSISREYRHPLAGRACATALLISPQREAELADILAKAHRHPHARHEQQHPVAVRRQPAEGAVRPRARLGRQDRADGRPDARRRYRHQARSLRPDAPRRRATAAPSSGTRPKPKSSTIATTSMSSATAASSPICDRGELTEEKIIQSSFGDAA